MNERSENAHRSTDEHSHDLCVCGHEAHLHGREADGTRGICIRDEWCECPGYHPNADYDPSPWCSGGHMTEASCTCGEIDSHD